MRGVYQNFPFSATVNSSCTIGLPLLVFIWSTAT